MGDISAIEARLARLEDIEAIRGVLADYCHFYDTGWEGAGRDSARVAALFTEDGVWDAGTVGSYTGREAIGGWCATYGHAAEMSVHIMMNPKIAVEGEAAHGTWTGLCPLVTPDGEAMWICGRYDCRLVRQAEGWKIALMKFLPAFQTPYADGFGKIRFFDAASYAQGELG